MRKTFAKVLSLTVTMLLILGTIMMPVSAAVPETGTVTNASYNGGGTNTTMYRASDAAEAVDSEGNDASWISSDSSVWKFGVSSLGDTFKASSADFAAPTAEPLEGGNFLKLSWTAPVEGKATVKVIADNYNKEVITSGDSITLGDVELGKTYQVQVTVGEVSSQILSYSHIYAPTYVTNSVFARKTQVASNSVRNFDYMFINVEDYTDYINSNAGILVKVTSNITNTDTNIISYYDYGTKTQIAYDAEDSAMTEPINIATGDVGVAFQTRFLLPIRDDKGGMAAGGIATANSEATKEVLYFNVDNGLSNKSSEVSNITSTLGLKSMNFNNGYIFIPFDLIDEASMATVKENGAVNLNLQYHYLYAKNLRNPNGTFAYDALNWEETDYNAKNGTELSGNIRYWFDREVHFSEVAFISDYNAFLDVCVDENDYTAGVAYQNLSKSSNTKDIVYLNTLVDESVIVNEKVTDAGVTESATLTDASVASTYAVSSFENITYTTAAGEKMSLGFTAPADGVYDVSVPITANADNGVYTRVIKEAADGTKTVIQAEAAYSGERHLVLTTQELALGDTLWFEAWANTPATVIDLGIPQMSLLQKYTDAAATKTYSWYTYFGSIQSHDGTGYVTQNVDPVMSYGYFINNFEVDGTEYDYIYAPNYDAATTKKHDMLGLGSLAAVDDETTEIDETDATALYNSLKKHEKSRGNVLKSIYDCYRYRNEGTSFGVEANATNGFQSSGVGITGTRQMRVSYGFTTAFGGNLNNVYYDAGVYMQFTAPSDGVITQLNPGNGDALTGKGVVLHNNKVISASITTYNALEIKNIEVKKGDTITICYGTTDGTNTFTIDSKGAEVRYKNVYDPRITFAPAKVETATVSYDQAIDTIAPEAYNVGDVINLPTVAKNGAIFQGWKDAEGNLYAAGTEYTVNADVAFVAQYLYYGDLNGSGEGVDGTDLSILRKMIVKVAEIEGAVNAELTGDIDADGAIDLIDLIKMKKMSAGMDVTVGAK